MCGRYAEELSLEDFEYLFGFRAERYEFKARFNIAPSLTVKAVRASEASDAGPAELVGLRWGLVPFWVKEPARVDSRGAKHAGSASRGNSEQRACERSNAFSRAPINARAESVQEKPSFREAFKRRRCVLPASGFFEWKRSGSVKVPFYIHPKEGPGLLMAGLWERNDRALDHPLESCAVVTTSPNEVMAPIHDRMPVLLAREDVPRWLHGSPEEAAGLLRPCPASWLAAHAVSTRVNSPRNDEPSLLDRI